ncbi:beta-lactamase-like protein [Radiomyces spectabilis]|uniref:beta-lactamase-like protein n=1 Tax=Radiomyces spectabilis TaxID=64574 RepID=UPI0022202B72|nr:beta-lactamase-like protein [Radiomyces spectabilis]KAI8373209.1 beta-lactamase-like protein [Radiomyces spectabilis]
MPIRVVPLGAGQDVGRSCILVTIGGKNVMLDCGFHMGYNDARRFPDFSYISKSGQFTDVLDAVIISHFHLDHCGALPYFTEMCGYDGPIYMTHPTKAIAPILLEDYRKITVDRKGETNFFTSEMIKRCMKKVVPINLHQTIQVDDELEIKAYYAGHVIGAAMFYLRVGQESLVYTGDYNMTPDRHLGSAWIDKIRPDVLITESTYGTTIRDSKRSRERDFLKKVHDCVQEGGKVLIPVFALGRAQELCILIESYWERMGLTVPIYFSAGLTERATQFYKLFINWTNQKIKSTFAERNMFDFKHIKPWDRANADIPGPMVCFATPGMLNVGTSLEIFKKWAPDPKNMIVMPGFCVSGTVGYKVLQGFKTIELDKYTSVKVNLQVRNLSFSAHADAKGIMQLIRHCEPRNVVLVHGQADTMDYLKSKIMKEFGIPCYNPANGVTITMQTSGAIPARISTDLLKSYLVNKSDSLSENAGSLSSPQSSIPIHATVKVTCAPEKNARQSWSQVELVETSRLFSSEASPQSSAGSRRQLFFQVEKKFNTRTLLPDLGGRSASAEPEVVHRRIMDLIHVSLIQALGNPDYIERYPTKLVLRNITLNFHEDAPETLQIRWEYQDEDLASCVLGAVNLALSS